MAPTTKRILTTQPKVPFIFLPPFTSIKDIL
jgi:hypothetical protein